MSEIAKSWDAWESKSKVLTVSGVLSFVFGGLLHNIIPLMFDLQNGSSSSSVAIVILLKNIIIVYGISATVLGFQYQHLKRNTVMLLGIICLFVTSSVVGSVDAFSRLSQCLDTNQSCFTTGVVKLVPSKAFRSKRSQFYYELSTDKTLITDPVLYTQLASGALFLVYCFAHAGTILTEVVLAASYVTKKKETHQ